MKRRQFIESSLALLPVLPAVRQKIATEPRPEGLRFGMITDLHYANRPTPEGNSRYYQESIDKLKECVDVMNRARVHFMIELGDLKDENKSPTESETLQFLKEIESVYAQFQGPRHYVLGNHDHDSISKQQFLDHIQTGKDRMAKNYYAFVHNGIKLVILDTNYNWDGSPYDKGNFNWKECILPSDQMNWLEKELSSHALPTIIFVHHRLDNTGDLSYMGPKNAPEIRKLLENSGQVLAVFQGHHHEGDHQVINNIHYYTLKAAVEGSGAENNSYAIVEVASNLNIEIKGFRRTESTQWSGA